MKKLLFLCVAICYLTYGYCQETSNRGLKVIGKIADKPFKNLYVLIVGISEYGNPSVKDLEFADDDARLFFTYLKTFYGEHLEKDGVKHYKLLLNENATQAKVNDGLNWLRQADEGDLVIIYFAGHGNVEDNEAVNAYFYCHGVVSDNLDATAIGFQKIDNQLTRFSQRGVQAMFIADACHSGLISSDPYKINYLLAGSPDNKKINEHRLLSSNQNQVSIESATLCNGHGYFTYYLIKGLLGEADGSDSRTGEKDAEITLHELGTYLQKDLYDATGQKQTPQIITNNDKFVIGRKIDKLPTDFSCLLEQGTASGFAYANAQDDKDFIRKGLTPPQQQRYDQFLRALAEKRFIGTAQNDAMYHFDFLKGSQLPGIVLGEIASQWKVAFQEYSQELINKYLANGVIPTYEKYELGAALMKRCLDYSVATDPSYNELVTRYIFLESYALHRKRTQYQSDLPGNEMRAVYERQIGKIREAIRLDPGAAYLHNVLGRFYRAIGDEVNGRIAYTRASVLAPNWAFPKYNLLQLNRNVSIPEKLKGYQEMAKSYPDYLDLSVELATTYRHSKINQPQKSLEVLKRTLARAVELKEDKIMIAAIHNAFGRHYWSEKDYVKAEEYFLKAVDLSGGVFSPGYYNLASMSRLTGKPEIALKYATAGLAVTPNDPDLISEMGWIYTDIGNYEEAGKSFVMSVSKDSLYAYGYFTIARLAKVQRKWELAQSYAMKAYQLATRQVDSTSQATYVTEMGSIFSEKGEYERALPYFEQAIKLDPESADGYYYLGYNYAYLKKYDEAIVSFKKSGELGYDVDEPIGYVLGKQGKKAESMVYYKKVLVKNPNNHNTMLLISDIFKESNQKDSALLYVEKVVFGNHYYQTKDYGKLDEYYLNLARNKKSRWAYYAVGMLWERGIGRKADVVQARKWYGYAYQMSFWPAAEKLINLYSSGKVPHPDKAEILVKLGKDQNGHRFTVPVMLPDSQKSAVDIYTMDFPLDEANPVGAEISRVGEVFQAKVANAVVESFGKLYELAKKNSVSFGDLCAYAIDAANSDKEKLTVNAEVFEKQAVNNVLGGSMDSVFIKMEKAVLARYNNFNGSFEENYRKIIQTLRSNPSPEKNFLDYYAMGYLFEHSATHQSDGKAIKWYTYAFQMGYGPAYVRLKALFKNVSESKVAWLDDNFSRGFTSQTYKTTNQDGTQTERTIYIMDFPVSSLNPMLQEEERLMEVYGSKLMPSLVKGLGELYALAEKEKVSFQLLYKKVIENNEREKLIPKDQRYVNAGTELVKQKKYKEAVEQFSLAIAENNKNAQAFYLRGITYVYLEDFAKSVLDLEAGVKLDPDNGACLNLLGLNYIRLKDYGKARIAYEKAYQLGQNKDNVLCYNLACIYSLKSQKLNALRFLEESFKNGYDDFEHLKTDSDLDNVRDMSRFKDLVARYSKK